MSIDPNVAAAATRPSSLWDQLHQAITWGKLLLLGVLAISSSLVALQVFWLYRTTSDVHPALGVLVLVGVGVGATIVAVPAYKFFRVPRIVFPPAIPDRASLALSHLRAEARFLDRYLAHAAGNPELSGKAGSIAAARSELAVLRTRLSAASANQLDAFDTELTTWTRRTMTGLLAELDERADRVIYQEALTVGLATAASPNGTLDAFVMLWRATRLVSQLAVLYYGRPGLWGTLAVMRDVSVATAMAGFLQNVTDSLGGLIAKSIGGATGVVAGPAVDGVTNALVLIRIGYLARERCRSFREWDARTRKSALVNALNATQKVAVGLAMEIMRQVGGKVGAVAEAVFSGASKAAGSTIDKVGDLANQAYSSVMAAASHFGQSLQSRFREDDD